MEVPDFSGLVPIVLLASRRLGPEPVPEGGGKGLLRLGLGGWLLEIPGIAPGLGLGTVLGMKLPGPVQGGSGPRAKGEADLPAVQVDFGLPALGALPAIGVLRVDEDAEPSPSVTL